MSNLQSKLHELDEWRDIVTSQGWKNFVKLLYRHSTFLKEQIIIAVKGKKYEEASDYESRLSECRTILRLVEERLAELKKEEGNA